MPDRHWGKKPIEERLEGPGDALGPVLEPDLEEPRRTWMWEDKILVLSHPWTFKKFPNFRNICCKVKNPAENPKKTRNSVELGMEAPRHMT